MTACKDRECFNFDDIEGFNLVILDKQGWKLLKNSSSILARVLKATYFPTSGLLDSILVIVQVSHGGAFGALFLSYLLVIIRKLVTIIISMLEMILGSI